MNRFDAIALVSGALADEPVVVSLGHPAYELFAAGDRPLNFYTWGSMGLTSSIALGLALACPQRRVVALDGDGSLLMNLGSLATIAACSPPNLLVLVLDNGQYGTTGGQATATARGADLGAAARAMGVTRAATVSDPAGLQGALDASRTEPGPWVIVVKVTESAPTTKPPLDCVYIKQRFMAALGCSGMPGSAGKARAASTSGSRRRP
ncbi:MAG TPA: thiamine pyrophosphate-dependent enzyme [Vicinamibacterales bacterium]